MRLAEVPRARPWQETPRSAPWPATIFLKLLKAKRDVRRGAKTQAAQNGKCALCGCGLTGTCELGPRSAGKTGRAARRGRGALQAQRAGQRPFPCPSVPDALSDALCKARPSSWPLREPQGGHKQPGAELRAEVKAGLVRGQLEVPGPAPWRTLRSTADGAQAAADLIGAGQRDLQPRRLSALSCSGRS